MKIDEKKTAAIITAGGSGLRMGGNLKKQYIELAGYPILYYSIKLFSDAGFTNIILTLPEEDINFVRKSILEKNNFDFVITVSGGKTRHHSVYNGLKALKNAEYVFIHDAVRPFATQKIIIELYQSITSQNNFGAIPVIRIKDTLKFIKDGFTNGTLNRNEIAAVQTPQAFHIDKLINAYELYENDLAIFTDDAAIMEKSGCAIFAVEGDYNNIKITTSEDLKLAEYMILRK